MSYCMPMMKTSALFCPCPSSRVLELDSVVQGNGILQLRRKLGFGVAGVRKKMVHANNRNNKRVCCKLQDGGDDSSNNGNKHPPESLFMKELRRRGISPTSPLEDINTGAIEEEIREGDDGSFSKRNAIATDSDRSLTNQRETSMALNSEGLEGLIPRAKLLLRLGATFFLAFWPLILVTTASFLTLYLYFGPTFVHDASNRQIAPPSYIDPYVLLQEERIKQ